MIQPTGRPAAVPSPSIASMDDSAGSSASTFSLNRAMQMTSKIPEKPSSSNWSSFIASYRRGHWVRSGQSSKASADVRRAEETSGQETELKDAKKRLDASFVMCPRSAQRVYLPDGSVVDNQDFFDTFKYFAAPPLPREKRKFRQGALRRHGFSGPQHSRPNIQRYAKHARNVFRSDFASVTVACSDERSTIVLGTDGHTCAATMTSLTAMAAHALLLDEGEVFVVPDLLEDWRFKQLAASEDIPLRFFASAPIMLSAPGDNKDIVFAHVGCLTVMRSEPWPEFCDVDAEILLDIAGMVQDALENEQSQKHAHKLEQMQRTAATLSYRLNILADSDASSPERTKDNKLGILSHPANMNLITEAIMSTMKASNVTAIDVSNIRILSTRSFSKNNTSSPRTNPTLHPAPLSTVYETASFSPARSSPSRDFSDENMTDPPSPESPRQAIQLASRHQHSRSDSSPSFPSSDDEFYAYDPMFPARIITSSGAAELCPEVSLPTQNKALCDFFTYLRKESLFTKPQWFDLGNDESSESDEDDENAALPRNVNVLQPLFSEDAKVCCAVPVFSNDRRRPLFILLVTWDDQVVQDEADKMFCYTIGIMSGALSFRQQAGMADRAQLDFIRSVQHELRTPLNGILGITDFLRLNLISNTSPENLDVKEGGLLANLLESIRLAGVNLSSALDDILDFGAVTGVTQAHAATLNALEEIDLLQEVHNACLDELEHISIQERQDLSLNVAHRVYASVPTLILRIADEVQLRYRIDRTKLKKVLRKFISNSLRYTDKDSVVDFSISLGRAESGPDTSLRATGKQQEWIDFVIHDHGMGMSEDFMKNHFFKPFSKADSFSQGIGLSVTIAASLIDQLGGRLTITSELGKGTRVAFSLPMLRHSVESRHPLHQEPLKYQISTAAALGFHSLGQKTALELIEARLKKNGVRIVDMGESPELIIVHEDHLMDDKTITDSDDGKVRFSQLPKPTGPCGRFLVVTRSPVRSRLSLELDGQAVWFLRPPFDPESLGMMDEFLMGDAPLILRQVPTPPLEARSNMEAAIHTNGLTFDEFPFGTTQSLGVVSMDVSSDSKQSSIGDTEHSDATSKTHISTETHRSDTLKPAISESKAPPAPVQSAVSAQQFRILVVEDNPVNMKLLTSVLQKGGYMFVEARDGLEAVEQYKLFEPALVLLDISLPLLDGFGACLQMRAHTLRHIPRIVAVTALSSVEDKIRGLEQCGMDDWRTKPLSIKTLRTDLVLWKREWQEAWV